MDVGRAVRLGRVFGAALIGVAALAPGAAQAASADSVVMFSDPGDYIGGGGVRLFTPSNGSISVGGSTAYLSVQVSGGTNGDGYSLEFAAPPGQILAPGVYDRAQRAPFREAGRPGIDIGGDGRGCNTIDGRFEVKDLAVSSTGVLERLWIVYEQHCEGAVPALFGEVRLGMPGPPGAGATVPAIVRWPARDFGRPGTTVPATILAGSPMQVSGVAVEGEHAGDFPIKVDECSGRSLAAGASCQVWVRFLATAPGTRVATLRVRDAAGNSYPTDLQGFSYGGRTRLVMHSDAGDYIGQGGDWSYTPANAVIGAGGSRRYVGFGIDGSTGDWWSGTFAAGDGDILAPGTYAATRYPFNGTGAGIDISGNGRGCNTITGTFTVTEATYESDGRLRTFGANFEQHCEGATPALRGTFEYRAGDTTPLAPWMVSSTGTSGSPTVFGGGATGTGTGTAGTGSPGPAPTVPGAGGVAGATSRSPCSTLRSFAKLPLRRGTRRSNRMTGTRRGERMLGFAGDDVIRGLGGSDCIDGAAGDDTLIGGSGNDRLIGGSGRDRLYGGPGRDTLVCGSGRDIAYAGRGDRLEGCERVVRPKR